MVAGVMPTSIVTPSRSSSGSRRERFLLESTSLQSDIRSVRQSDPVRRSSTSEGGSVPTISRHAWTGGGHGANAPLPTLQISLDHWSDLVARMERSAIRDHNHKSRCLKRAGTTARVVAKSCGYGSRIAFAVLACPGRRGQTKSPVVRTGPLIFWDANSLTRLRPRRLRRHHRSLRHRLRHHPRRRPRTRSWRRGAGSWRAGFRSP